MHSLGIAVLRKLQRTRGSPSHTGKRGEGVTQSRHTGRLCSLLVSWTLWGVQALHFQGCWEGWVGEEGLGVGLVGFTWGHGYSLRGAQGAVLVGDQGPEKEMLTSWKLHFWTLKVGLCPKWTARKSSMANISEILGGYLFCPQLREPWAQGQATSSADTASYSWYVYWGGLEGEVRHLSAWYLSAICCPVKTNTGT